MFCFMALNGLFGRFMSAQVAFFAAYPPALVLHFLLNKLWTFGDRRATSGRHVAEYIYTVAVTFFIQWPVFTLCVHLLGWKPWLAAGVANMAQMTASFLLMQIRVFRSAPTEAEESAAAAWHRLACLLTGVGVAAVITWTALQKWEFPPVKDKQLDYYNLLARGFSKGSLALDLEVPEALKNAENPWDPAKRPPGVAPQDISYFDGKYYLYFGVVPAVLVVWPFQRITGLDLPQIYTVIFFCIGAFLLLARLWLSLLKDHFPSASLTTKLGGLLALGFAGGLLVVARRGSIWEMPIAAGQFFMAATLLAAYRALRSEKPWRWLAATGLLMGLAVGSRPTLALAGGGLVVLVLAIGGVRTAAARGRSVRAALAAGIPLALVVGALLAYNHARFGRIFEFGLNYQLTSVYEAKAQHFSPTYAHFNWLMYFWNAPQWGRDFPFLNPVDMKLAAPSGYYGWEYTYGAFMVSPLIWFALLLPTWALGRNRGLRSNRFPILLLTVTAGLTGVLLCFNTATARYTADFMPWWLLLGLLGWAAAERSMGKWPWARRAGRSLFAATAIFTGVVAYCASVELHGVFAFLNPEGYAKVARVFNQPTALWEKAFPRPAGAIDIELIFPERPASPYEPILTTGIAYEAGYVFVHYIDSARLEFGIVQSGKRAVLSESVAFKPGQKYRLRIDTGALYPPKEHPFFATWETADVLQMKAWTSLVFDDREVLDVRYALNDASPGAVQVGVNPQENKRFSGTMVAVRRSGLPPRPMRAARGGDVLVELNFPTSPNSAPQPLVMAGKTGNADIVSIRFPDEKRFQIGYESWSAGFWESQPMAVTPGRVGTLRVRLGSLLDLDDRSPLAVLRQTVGLWVDGRPVWWREIGVPLEKEAPVEVGINTIRSTAVSGFYEGRIKRWERGEPPVPWRVGPFQALELVIGGRGEGAEPLVATGVTGAADTLAVEWLAGGQARLIYDHWSAPAIKSDPFQWPENTAHSLRLEMPSFAALDSGNTGIERAGALRVWVDGRLVWDTNATFWTASPDSVVLARNRVGASVAGERLRAVVLDVEQRGLPGPAANAEGHGK